RDRMRHAAQTVCVTEPNRMPSPRIIHNCNIRAIEQARFGEPRWFHHRNPRHSSLRCTKFGKLVGKADSELAGRAITPEARRAGFGDGAHEGCPGRLTPHDLARQGISFWMIVNCEAGGSHGKHGSHGKEPGEVR